MAESTLWIARPHFAVTVVADRGQLDSKDRQMLMVKWWLSGSY